MVRRTVPKCPSGPVANVEAKRLVPQLRRQGLAPRRLQEVVWWQLVPVDLHEVRHDQLLLERLSSVQHLSEGAPENLILGRHSSCKATLMCVYLCQDDGIGYKCVTAVHPAEAVFRRAQPRGASAITLPPATGGTFAFLAAHGHTPRDRGLSLIFTSAME